MTTNQRVQRTFLAAVLIVASLAAAAPASASVQFVAKWGSAGTGSGQFNQPYDVAVGPDGSVYVVDRGNHRIQKFDSDGAFVTKWGSNGSGPGQFSSPAGIDVGPDGTVYVADWNNSRIERFDADGAFLGAWGTVGIGDGQFQQAQDVAVAADGSVYVADYYNGRIQRFTATGTFVTKWGSLGGGDAQFFYATSLDIGPDGSVYVADYNNQRIQRFAAGGQFLSKWSVGWYPEGVGVGSDGSVYVADATNRVQKFSASGLFSTLFGSSGSGDGQFSYPTSVAAGADGVLYVVDHLNNRVQKFVDQIDGTPPVISPHLAGTLGDNGWYTSDVLLTWTVSEPESPGSLVRSGCTSRTIDADQAATTYSCSATSLGGTAGPVTVSVKRDAHAPSVTCGAAPTGWLAENVTLSCTAGDVGPGGLADASDAGFQLSTTVPPGTETSAATTATRTVRDQAGNTSVAGPFTFRIDRRAPDVWARPAGDACSIIGHAGWCRGVQSAGFAAEDGGSGLAPDGASISEFTRAGASDGTAVTIGSGAVEDLVGNRAAVVTSGPYNVDTASPVVTCPAPTPAFTLDQAGATVTAGVSDADSGAAAATITASADTATVGAKTVSLTGHDVAGNAHTVDCAYQVLYDWSGFFQPIDNRDANGGYVMNRAKSGSAIPVKFRLGGDQGPGVLAPGSPSSGAISCSGMAPDAIEEYATTTVSGLKYDAATGQYVYTWKTQSTWAGSCRELIVTLADGSVHRARFQFFK